MAVFERLARHPSRSGEAGGRYLKKEYHLLPQWLTMWGLPAQAHVIVKRNIVSLAPGYGCLFFGGCPEEGSIGDPVKTACFRLILRPRAINHASRFHAGQSCLLLWACPGATKLACCAIPDMCRDSNLLNVTSASQVWARGHRKKKTPMPWSLTLPCLPPGSNVTLLPTDVNPT